MFIAFRLVEECKTTLEYWDPTRRSLQNIAPAVFVSQSDQLSDELFQAVYDGNLQALVEIVATGKYVLGNYEITSYVVGIQQITRMSTGGPLSTVLHII